MDLVGQYSDEIPICIIADLLWLKIDASKPIAID